MSTGNSFCVKCLEHVHIAFYVIFLILFIIAIHNLRRRETAGKKVLLGFSWAMAALGTAQVVLSIAITVGMLRLLQELVKQRTDLNPGPVPAPPLRTVILLGFAANLVFLINNLTADLLFLYRCYVIWGRQKKVLIVPGVFILLSFVSGCVASIRDSSVTFAAAGYIMAAATNLVLVAFTAGRIWITRRDAIYVGTDSALKNRYSTVITTIMESGALYCLITILSAVTNALQYNTIAADITYDAISSASAQLANILPTLIIVRAGMGYNIQDRIESLHVPRTTLALSVVERGDSSYGVLDLRPGIEEEAIV
ncbi:hypothetical protein K438DRAFT_980266 [Mycena galopus ATCC 62051]|nr:hypothetical protein K438DRAFT_980266 [Mycena galopus ATCC 62051]